MNCLLTCAVIVSLFHADCTNRYVEIDKAKIYWDEPALGMDVERVDFLSMIQPVNSNVNFDCVTSSGKQATLVAPDVAIGCAHYHYNVGDSITFGGESAIVEQVLIPDDYQTMWHDISFVKLDRELGIEPAILAPTNWFDYFEYSGSSYGFRFEEVPCVMVNHYGEVLNGIICYGYSSNSGEMTARPVTYDSGSPIMFIINDKPVLFGIAIAYASGNTKFSCPQTNLLPVTRGWIKNKEP